MIFTCNVFRVLTRSRIMPYYAVNQGRNPGIYTNWSDCKAQVDGYSGATYKKFSSLSDANQFATGSAQSANNGGGSYHSSYMYSCSSSSSSLPHSYTSRSSAHQLQHSQDKAVVYTDGACPNNGYPGASAGIGVYWGKDDPRNVSESLPGRQTNNRAEIHAAAKAISQAKSQGINDLEIKTDSKFLIDSMTKYVPNWQRNDWKLANGGPVKNREDFEALLSAKGDDLKVTWTYVPGHSGIAGNEEADRLANEAIQK